MNATNDNSSKQIRHDRLAQAICLASRIILGDTATDKDYEENLALLRLELEESSDAGKPDEEREEILKKTAVRMMREAGEFLMDHGDCDESKQVGLTLLAAVAIEPRVWLSDLPHKCAISVMTKRGVALLGDCEIDIDIDNRRVAIHADLNGKMSDVDCRC